MFQYKSAEIIVVLIIITCITHIRLLYTHLLKPVKEKLQVEFWFKEDHIIYMYIYYVFVCTLEHWKLKLNGLLNHIQKDVIRWEPCLLWICETANMLNRGAPYWRIMVNDSHMDIYNIYLIYMHAFSYQVTMTFLTMLVVWGSLGLGLGIDIVHFDVQIRMTIN